MEWLPPGFPHKSHWLPLGFPPKWNGEARVECKFCKFEPSAWSANSASLSRQAMSVSQFREDVCHNMFTFLQNLFL